MWPIIFGNHHHDGMSLSESWHFFNWPTNFVTTFFLSWAAAMLAPCTVDHFEPNLMIFSKAPHRPTVLFFCLKFEKYLLKIGMGQLIWICFTSSQGEKKISLLHSKQSSLTPWLEVKQNQLSWPNFINILLIILNYFAEFWFKTAHSD